MNKIYIGNSSVSLSDKQLIGKGGEADVYGIGNNKVLKLFKSSDHPDYANSVDDQKGAVVRLLEHQTKLLDFPKGLPPEVISPIDLAKDSQGNITGYTMNFLKNTEVLLHYGEKSFRSSGISDESVISIFRKLLISVQALHDKNMVIGDFNDLNVLVKGTTPYIIDADSMQYGNWKCKVFTGKFVDPLLCDSSKKSPFLIKPHNEMSDWYAYYVMLMQSLLFVGPYGGVFKPKDKSKKIPHDARPLHGISVWDKQVRYPKPAKPLDILPDSFQNSLRDIFVEGKREIPSATMLNNLQFDKFGELLSVTKPSTAHNVLKEIVTGSVTANKVFSTSGQIVYATFQNSKLRWLYHSNNSFKREDGREVVTAVLNPNIRYRIAGKKTVFAQSQQAMVFNVDSTKETLQVDSIGNLPLIDANSKGLIYVQEGKLSQVSSLGMQYSGEMIGEVLPNQTLFWVSENLGFSFYRASRITRYSIFNPNTKGMIDDVILPPINGKITGVSCKFSHASIWFFLSIREGSKSINNCYLLSSTGKLVASATSSQGDGSWLGEIQGSCAVANILLVPTDEGINKVEVQGSSLVVTKEFSETSRFVDTSSKLFPAKGGIFVQNPKEIWKLTI